jgi:hypothetical protein
LRHTPLLLRVIWLPLHSQQQQQQQLVLVLLEADAPH